MKIGKKKYSKIRVTDRMEKMLDMKDGRPEGTFCETLDKLLSDEKLQSLESLAYDTGQADLMFLIQILRELREVKELLDTQKDRTAPGGKQSHDDVTQAFLLADSQIRTENQKQAAGEMNLEEINEMLGKQMKLLSERAHNPACDTRQLVGISHAMAEITEVIIHPIWSWYKAEQNRKTGGTSSTLKETLKI